MKVPGVIAEALTSRDKRELVDRVADSELFRRAPRQREFLLYVAGCTLESRLDSVREQSIAERVFGRTPDQYDLGDTIVRAEARNLRKRLEKYFETEGANEPWLIEMPKGAYAIAFQPRASERTASEEVEAKASTSEEETRSGVFSEALTPALVSAPIAQTSWTSKPVVLLALAALIVVVVTSFGFRIWRSAPAHVNTAAQFSDTLPFSELFTPNRDTLIVTSDTSFLQIAELTHRRLRLDDFLTRRYPAIPNLSPPDLIDGFNRFQYTDADETSIAASIMRENAGVIQRTFLRSGHQVSLSDFQSSNIVLLGSAISNPWAELYANRLNFEFDFKDKVGIVLLNKSPRPGEPAAFPEPDDGAQNRTYAQLAFIPADAGRAGGVLLLAGTTAEATQAAGEFLLDRAKFARTLESIGIDPKSHGQFFELLLRAKTFVGGATESELVAHRLRPAGD